MKKITWLFLLVCLSLPVSGWATPVNVYFDQQVTEVNVGDIFTVNIMADMFNPVLGWGLDLTFDSTFLTMIGTPTIGTNWDPAFAPDGDGLAGIAFPPSFGSNTLLLATLSFEAIAAGTSDLYLGVTAGDFSEGFALIGEFADVTFKTASVTASNPVPEPTTIILLALGLVGFAGVRRKKFKK